MRIVSNEFDFDEGGFLRGFKPPPILSFNKNFGSLSKTGGNKNYFEELSQRHNVILMGDNIGDVHMADGIKVEGNTILKIGFLEAKVKLLHNIPVLVMAVVVKMILNLFSLA